MVVSMLICLGSVPTNSEARSAVGESNAEKATTPVVAHFHLSGMVSESPVVDPFGFTAGQITSLKALVGRINKAAAELYIRLGEHVEDESFGRLPLLQRVKVMLETASLKGSKVYMFRDFAVGIPAGFLEPFIDELQELKSRGVAVLYLTADVLLASKIGDSAGSLRAASAPSLGAYNLV